MEHVVDQNLSVTLLRTSNKLWLRPRAPTRELSHILANLSRMENQFPNQRVPRANFSRGKRCSNGMCHILIHAYASSWTRIHVIFRARCNI